MNRIKKSLAGLDGRLFGTLLLMGLLPTAYVTVRIYFLGDLPVDWGVNIASQMAWVQLIYEVLQEAILLPVFYLMGSALADREGFGNRVRTGLTVTFLLYSIVTVALWVFTEPLLALMSQKPELIEASARYIRLETVASLLSTLAQFMMLVLVTLRHKPGLLALLGLQTILSVLSDTFLISSLPFSLRLGVNGIALGNIGVNALLLVLSLILFRRAGYSLLPKKGVSLLWLGEWFKVGAYSGLESLVRNLAFMFMVVRMVNVVGEQGTFWVANNFIWGWLLLPVLQLGQLIKRDCGERGDQAIRERSLGYFAVTAAVVLVWLATMPLWKPFLRVVMNVAEYQKVYRIAVLSAGFYVLFAFNNVIDSVFYGIGKTEYMLFQSIAVNSLYYGTLFILWQSGIYKPDLTAIALMFAGGIASDSLLTYGMFAWMLRKRGIRIWAD